MFLFLLILIPNGQAAQCNQTSIETLPTIGLNLNSSVNGIGYIYTLIISNDASSFYIACGAGLRAKFDMNGSLIWAKTYESWGYAIGLSEDETYLIAGGKNTNVNDTLFKINALNGNYISSSVLSS